MGKSNHFPPWESHFLLPRVSEIGFLIFSVCFFKWKKNTIFNSININIFNSIIRNLSHGGKGLDIPMINVT